MVSMREWKAFGRLRWPRWATGRWVGMVLAGCLALPAWGTSSPPSPKVYAEISSPYLTIARNVEPRDFGKYAYTFHGVVSWPEHDVMYPQGADVYFGILMPGGTSVQSWTLKDGVVTLVPGFVPFARAIPNTTLFQAFADSSQRPITRVFQDTDPKGLHFVFLILVSPGADPNDSRQWREVSTQPFVVK
jgi:hypothetical protein